MAHFNSVHLTKAAFEQVLAMSDAVDARGAVDASERPRVDWSDFDSVYLHLYRLTLMRRLPAGSGSRGAASRNARSARDVRSASSVVKVEHMLDMELESEGSPRRLPSEFAVHSLIDFRNAFLTTVELDAEVTDVDVGCVMLVFEVDLPAPVGALDRNGNAYGRDDGEAARRLINRRSSSNHWIDLSHRFSVKHQWIDGCLTF